MNLSWGAAWALARRGLDWRFKGLRLLLVCLVLGTAALSAIGTLTGAIERELATRGREMLGADLEFTLAARQPSPDESAAIAALGEVSEGARLQAMARVPSDDTRTTPVELKAVDGRWPLYGQFTLEGGKTAGAPEGMAAWIAPGVADRLGVRVGDRLRVGEADLTVGGVIGSEPDRLAEGFSLGPTVIVSKAALDASKLVQPGSMVRTKLRVKLPGSADAVALGERIKTQFPLAGYEVRTREKASPGLDRFVSRMGQFLVLVALAALAIAGIGIGNGVNSYLEARRGSIATLKILGASSGDIARIYLLQLAAASSLAILGGLAIGVSITPLIGKALQGLLPIEAGFVLDWGALAIAAAYGALIALTFAAPPLARAKAFPAMALMRARVSPLSGGWQGAVLPVALGLGGIVALAVLTAPQKLLAAGFLGGAAALFVLLSLLGWGLQRMAAKLPRPEGAIARMALANLHRPGAQTSALVVALGFGLAAFVLLAGVQTSLDGNIALRVPNKAPDYFVLDLPQGKTTEFDRIVKTAAPEAVVRKVPALRGSITAYGPQSAMIRVADLKEIPEIAWPLRGDRGLTYSNEVPEGNVLTAGEWWPKGYSGEPLVSVDDDLREALGLKLGDRIAVSILGVERSAKIASFRRIDWENMGFNYVLVFSPNAIADAPHNLAATISLPDQSKTPEVRRAILGGLVKALPSSSVIEIGPVLGQAREILSQMGTAILAAASVAILAGMAVLAGAIAAARERKTYDNVILRVLGASRRQLLVLLLAEYGLLSALLAGVALLLGTGVAWGVIVLLFEFDWLPDWPRILGVLGGGVALVMVLAVAGSVGLLRTRPAQVLREL
ncbi:ABC transporter permease [Novosphingobium taihuense]|uniref:Putative ABC transport system permease protein n=1 Tax=Novosphingobium taihuense TaxID=260085 RepID=A0A7W7AE44_9SPHN|nr:FtsX-like permease family protein [Novosphingobium taihuense]MBB4615231.1 putative ABC transport system permease protein [Novosphingobium taihuense]TWH84266.1 putative ABC transport system permease protein [Novosphingobium taihuense]